MTLSPELVLVASPSERRAILASMPMPALTTRGPVVYKIIRGPSIPLLLGKASAYFALRFALSVSAAAATVLGVTAVSVALSYVL